MSRLGLVLACTCWLGVADAALADDLVGRASVIDGDTLEIRGERIRLWGIDAPESRQTCRIQTERWRCGHAAALALADRIGERPVSCELRGTDRWGRAIGVCEQAGTDLGRWLVRSGLALAYRRYSEDYVAEEDAARSERAGVWRSAFKLPWDWRHNRESPTVTAGG